jgi:pyruvate dehydrogenase E1 component beta subunit
VALLQIREALNQALDEEMARDNDVILLGEEVALYNGAYKVSKGLYQKYGAERVRDTTITEEGFAGIGIGAAAAGLRPVVEFMTFNFAFQAIDQLINNAAKWRYMSGGQFKVPIVFRGPNGAARMLAAQHSQFCETFYAHVPGLKVVIPSTAKDFKGLLKSSIRDDNPVIFMEREIMYGMRGEVPEDPDLLIPLGVGEVKREGADCTIVAWSLMVHTALEAADLLEKEGIQCEIVDPRTIRPLDIDIILKSVEKTNRVVIVEEGWPFSGVGAQISHEIQFHAFDSLDAPVYRVTGDDIPMPYSEVLELSARPDVQKIVRAVKSVCYV